MLPCRYPLIQAPMAGGATTANLVAAVCRAGGLGSLGAGYLPASAISEAVAAIRARCDGPFAINLFIPGKPPAPCPAASDALQWAQRQLNVQGASAVPAVDFDAQFAAVLAARPAVFSFTFGRLAKPYLRALKSAGICVMGTATNHDEARQLVSDGVDAVVLQGSEAGGHRGSTSVEGLAACLPLADVWQQCQSLPCPLIVAGAVSTGQQWRYWLDKGAAAVQMGTAFLFCDEAGISSSYRQALLAGERDTALTRVFSGRLARGLNNHFMRQQESAVIADYPLQNALTRPLRQAAAQQGNPEFQSLWAGTGYRQCRALSAPKLMATLVAEADL